MTLQNTLSGPSSLIMLFSDILRSQRFGRGRQWIHGWINAELSDGALQHDSRVQVSESVSGRRIGEVICGHVNGLKRGNRSVVSRSNSFRQVAHFRSQRRLITDRRGSTTEQRRNLGTSLRKTEDIVDKQQHVLVLLIPKVLCHGQRRETDA